MKISVIISSAVLLVVVGCKTADPIRLPVTRNVHPSSRLIVTGVTSPARVDGRQDYASVAIIEFRDAADQIVESRYSYLPMSRSGEQFVIVSSVPKGAKTAVVDKVDVRPDVQVGFAKFEAYSGNGGLADTERFVGKIDSLAALVTEALTQDPAHALERSIAINDVCPIRFEVDVVGAGMEKYRRNAILCQVEFRDVEGNLLKATGVSSNERYGDWFYIGVAPGENSFRKTIQPPKGAKSLTLKLSRFYNKYDLSIKKFEVVH